MNEATAAKNEQILEAALKVFSQYGYKRSTMNDIAEATGMSRAAIYTYFKNKDEIFRGLALKLHEHSLQVVSDAFVDSTIPFKERLNKAVLKKFEVYQFVHESPHGGELLTLGLEVTAEFAEKFEEDFINLLVGHLEKAETSGEISLEQLGMNAKEFAELLTRSSIGLEKRGLAPQEIKEKIDALVRVFGATL